MKHRVVYHINRIFWYFNHEWHRDGDLPARCYFHNRELVAVYYYAHDKYHCTTGPAIIDYVDKEKWYYYQNREYNSLEQMLMAEACK